MHQSKTFSGDTLQGLGIDLSVKVNQSMFGVTGLHSPQQHLPLNIQALTNGRGGAAAVVATTSVSSLSDSPLTVPSCGAASATAVDELKPPRNMQLFSRLPPL